MDLSERDCFKLDLIDSSSSPLTERESTLSAFDANSSQRTVNMLI